MNTKVEKMENTGDFTVEDKKDFKMGLLVFGIGFLVLYGMLILADIMY